MPAGADISLEKGAISSLTLVLSNLLAPKGISVKALGQVPAGSTPIGADDRIVIDGYTAIVPAKVTGVSNVCHPSATSTVDHGTGRLEGVGTQGHRVLGTGACPVARHSYRQPEARSRLEFQAMTDRCFSILDRQLPSIPWSLIEPHADRAASNHYQTLDGLDRRGGLHPSEACAVLENRPYRRMTDDEARETLRRYVDDHLTGAQS